MNPGVSDVDLTAYWTRTYTINPDFPRVTQLLLKSSEAGISEAALGLYLLKTAGLASPEVPEAAELKRQTLASDDPFVTLYLFPSGVLEEAHDERMMKVVEDAAATGHPLAQAKLVNYHYWRMHRIWTCHLRQNAIRRGEQRRHATDAPCLGKKDAERHVAAVVRIASAIDIQNEPDAEQFRFWMSFARNSTSGRSTAGLSPLTELRAEYVSRKRDGYSFEIAEALARAGDILVNGYFWRPDPRLAGSYLEVAASLGNDDAQYQLGTLYRDGKGFAKDFETAARYFAQAATQGNEDAARALGMAFAKGEGVSKNFVMAYFWLNVASMGTMSQLMSSTDISERRREQLDDPALARDRIARLMKAEETAEAQRRVRDWRPSPQKGAPPEMASVTAGIPSRGSKPTKQISGSGFYVSKLGHLITNAHVVADCREIRVKSAADPAQRVSADASIDLALLKTGGERETVAPLRRSDEIKLGEVVYTFGFPLSPILGETGNLTSGVVSSLQGPNNNSSLVQITAPIQAGNSGGPLLDSKGHVVGVVVGKLDALKVARATGDIPQNVNFAVRLHALRAFLSVNGVKYEQGSFLSFEKRADEIPALSGAFTTIVECWR